VHPLSVTKSKLLQFMRTHRLAVEASVSPEGAPQCAVVGIALTDAFELVFDTLNTTRKSANLRRNSRIAFVLGGLTEGDERTVQYEGISDEPSGAELERVKAVYFEAWPDGRSRTSWPGLVYVRVQPIWIRYSDFTGASPLIVEFDGASLREDQ
jgi:hypothetical protein